MIRLKLNGNIVAPRILTHILVFVGIFDDIFNGYHGHYLHWLDFETALGGVATSLGNVGPSIGKLSPVDNFAWVPTNAKWVFTVLMLMGRLELFTVIIILRLSSGVPTNEK